MAFCLHILYTSSLNVNIIFIFAIRFSLIHGSIFLQLCFFTFTLFKLSLPRILEDSYIFYGILTSSSLNYFASNICVCKFLFMLNFLFFPISLLSWYKFSVFDTFLVLYHIFTFFLNEPETFIIKSSLSFPWKKQLIMK